MSGYGRDFFVSIEIPNTVSTVNKISNDWLLYWISLPENQQGRDSYIAIQNSSQ
jgi:hypothetical protein